MKKEVHFQRAANHSSCSEFRANSRKNERQIWKNQKKKKRIFLNFVQAKKTLSSIF